MIRALGSPGGTVRALRAAGSTCVCGCMIRYAFLNFPNHRDTSASPTATEADLPTLLAYRNDPVVAQFQGWDSMTEAEGRALIEQMREAQPGLPGFGFQFAVERKVDGLHSGDCFLKLREDDLQQAELVAPSRTFRRK